MHHASPLKDFLSRKVIFGSTLGGAVAFMILGVLLWGGFNWGMEATNTTEFCISCHEMKDNVYAEFKGTPHDTNHSGVGAGCPDCHVPDPWVHKIVRKIRASSEVYHWLLGTVNTPEKFDAHRLTMAKRVWAEMKYTDSRECRNCHSWEMMNPELQKPRSRQQHIYAMENGHTCIDCHKGIAHKPAHDQLSEEELEKWNAPLRQYIRELPERFVAGMERIAIAEAEAEAQQQQESARERERRRAAQQAEQQRIETAVAEALAAHGVTPGASVSPAPAVRGFGIEWAALPERQITLFYPGQASMEWTLVGSQHGGARPFRAGDTCASCHAHEAAEMGRKLVTGEKAEETPIPGKRGSIPLTVQTAHDDEHLYFRFQWEAGDHAPVPFVEGGKMDPENRVKLAIMIAKDEVEYAAQAGCWGSCHHDSRGMPVHPENPTAAGLPLDLHAGVTKYLKESRTHVEEAGRRGATLGGWDKLRPAEELAAALAAGRYMDLLRWSSSGVVENGYVLAERVLKESRKVAADGWLEGEVWNLEIRRPLTSEQHGDLPLQPGTLYNIGFAIHDDHADGRFHHVSLGYRLGLDHPEAEINAVRSQVTSPTEAPASAPAAATTTAPTEAPASAPAAATTTAEEVVVVAERFRFTPQEVTVTVGTSVRWENHERRQFHNVWFRELGEEPGEYFFPGESVSRTFDQPGVYPYLCEPHENHNMAGVIRVVE